MIENYQNFRLTASDMEIFFKQKYGLVSETGWSPRIRHEHGYYLPGDIYEALVSKIIVPGSRWIDVGGGDAVFPHNPNLSKELAERAELLVAVDPSPNVQANPYADVKQQSFIEDFETDVLFDVATFRMVVEHIEHPDSVLNQLSKILKPGGVVVIYTVNKFCPIPVIAKLMPYRTHAKLLKVFGDGREEEHIFPVHYKMNTRRELRQMFHGAGFEEVHFQRLDDLSTTINRKLPHLLDNKIRKGLNLFGIGYPEYNLLGVYCKR